MKNQKILLISLIVSFVISSIFVLAGVNVMSKYSNNSGDWHFKAALVGMIIFSVLLIVSLFGFLVILFPKYFKARHLHRFERKN